MGKRIETLDELEEEIRALPRFTEEDGSQQMWVFPEILEAVGRLLPKDDSPPRFRSFGEFMKHEYEAKGR